MYLAFFGIAEKPFAITPDPRYLYLGRHHADALAHLVYGINDAGGFIQLTGEVGTGKTTTIRSLLARAPQNAEIALVINPRLSPLDFLQTICEELGIGVPDGAERNAKELVDLLNRYLLRSHAAGRRVVLIVDEAQNLAVEVLEQVRLLTNLETESQKLLQIILIGQPELRELLGRNELRQLAQRVTARFHLQPLGREDTLAYVRHRLRVAGATREIFSRAALREVHRLSGGVPRVINIICDRAMLGAYSEDQHQVSPAMVRRAASEIFGERLAPAWLTPAIAAGCLLLAAAAAALLWRQAPRPHLVAPAASVIAAPAQTPSPPPSPPAPTLAQLLAAGPADTSADTAFGVLFALWNAHYQPGATDACTQAEAQGLYCVTLHSSLAQLRQFARPVILMLGDSSAGTQQVVLIGVGADFVQLQIGARSARVSIADLTTFWFGDCVLLWHPPTPPVPELRPGMRGPAVRALRTQLMQATGAQPANAAASTLYDAGLSKLVEDFQRAHHLNVDGIATMETQLILDGVMAAPGSPILQSLNATSATSAG
jgi:general secretion pathway protein A